MINLKISQSLLSLGPRSFVAPAMTICGDAAIRFGGLDLGLG